MLRYLSAINLHEKKNVPRARLIVRFFSVYPINLQNIKALLAHICDTVYSITSIDLVALGQYNLCLCSFYLFGGVADE